MLTGVRPALRANGKKNVSGRVGVAVPYRKVDIPEIVGYAAQIQHGRGAQGPGEPGGIEARGNAGEHVKLFVGGFHKVLIPPHPAEDFAAPAPCSPVGRRPPAR